MTPLERWARRSGAVRTVATPALALRRYLASRRLRPRLDVWERMQDALAEDPLVRVPEFEGVFRLDVRSHVLQRLVLDGSYEPESAALCRVLADPTRDAVDVGANAGFFSVLLARTLPKRWILAVEPSPVMADRLRDNLDRNGVGDRVEIVQAALADTSGTADLRRAPGNEEYATIGVAAHPSLGAVTTPITAEPVALDTLDALVERTGIAPGFIKVDVEGAEMLVFRGAQTVLRTHRPVLLSELNDDLLRANGTSGAELIGVLEAEGYRVRHPFVSGHPIVTEADLKVPHWVTDVLCVPVENDPFDR